MAASPSAARFLQEFEPIRRELQTDSPNLDHAGQEQRIAARRAAKFRFRNITIGEVAHAAITVDFNDEEGAKGKFTPSCETSTSTERKVGKTPRTAWIFKASTRHPSGVRIVNSTFDNVRKGNVIKNLKDVRGQR